MEAPLPFELLSYILLLLYKDPSIPRAEDDFENTHKLQPAMMVCKRWKHVVERSPVLWTDMWLGHSPRRLGTTVYHEWLESVEVQINRSGKLPLNLNIMVECVMLDGVLRVLKPHLSRCRWLGLRGSSDEAAAQDKCSKLCVDTTPSVIHRLLSSPFPALNFLSIDDFIPYRIVETDDGDTDRFVFIDAPNLISITSRCPHLKAMVKSLDPSAFTHPSLQDLSLCGSWSDNPFVIPTDIFNLPNLKNLRLENTDYLWQLLSALSTPYLENLVVACGLAYWPPASELPFNASTMMHLRRLEWHTSSNAECEAPSLRCLLRHSPSLISFAYICDTDYEDPRAWARNRSGPEEIDEVLNILFEKEVEESKLCPNLRSLSFVFMSLDNVVGLIELWPALERISIQARETKDVVITGSREEWRIKVDQMKWIRSRVEFVFPTLELPTSLLQEENIAWDPDGTTDGMEGV
ncbi:hypothetical protein FRC01_002673 [Tulasnella sp. 417]|nr:hypothetical protein FRC01_002673 [Tulasnella sp. 417]